MQEQNAVGPAFFSPAISTPAFCHIWSRIFLSHIFGSRIFSVPRIDFNLCKVLSIYAIRKAKEEILQTF